MRTALVMLMVLVLGGVTLGSELTAPGGSFLLRAVGNGDLIKGEVGWRPGWSDDRTEIGVYGQWIDGVTGDELESLGPGVYATYDVIHDAPFKIPGFDLTVPSTVYVGTLLGAVKPEAESWDATAGLMTGLTFGDKQVRIGVRAEYFLTSTLWTELADIPQDARVLASVEYRFSR